MTEKTAVITCVDKYMGKVIKKKFESLEIKVISGSQSLTTEQECEKIILEANKIDILIANLAEQPMTGPVQSIKNADWHKLFDELVHPLMYLIRAVTPQMIARKSGKIIAITSAAPLKGVPNNTAYCAARSAQNGFIKAVGLELARSNIHVNAIAQNYVQNSSYYPEYLLKDQKFLDHVKRNVPTNKVGSEKETAELAAYLASENCNHIVGQIIPLAGGWTT